MNLNKSVRIGSPSGPLVPVVEDSRGKISLLTSTFIAAGTNIYSESGDFLFPLDTKVEGPATFYESRTEQQTLTEDGPSGPYRYGWIAKHLGWEVNFDRGIALYGELASVNQNRQNVGIEGPTSTAGTNGSPAVLTQNISITNRNEQVNGWKSYDSPTAYLLDPSDVQQVDSAYVYADAFISWTADSSTVQTPGSDMVGLVEYPPTNTIRYTT